ncbi:MAG: hypothetical protein M3Q10_10250 [Chloroflexota bacterium]|nr:hypothetical protein [Chloroflexota bacterium]
MAGGLSWCRPLALSVALALAAHGAIYVAVGLVPSVALAAALLFYGGLVTGPTDVFSKLIRQKLISVDSQGRVSSIAASLAFAGSPVGPPSPAPCLGPLGARWPVGSWPAAACCSSSPRWASPVVAR